MTPSHDQGFHLAQLGRHSFSDRLPPQREPSSPRLRAHVREAEECERLGPAEAPSPAVLDGEPPKLDQARLLGVELQAEPGETLHQVRVEPLGVSTMLKADNEVVGKPHDDHVTVSLPVGTRSAGTSSSLTAFSARYTVALDTPKVRTSSLHASRASSSLRRVIPALWMVAWTPVAQIAEAMLRLRETLSLLHMYRCCPCSTRPRMRVRVASRSSERITAATRR